MLNPRRALVAPLALLSLLAAGCGGSSSKTTSSAAGAGQPPRAQSPGGSQPTGGAAAPAGGSPSALSAEATSAATGDIPDNQVFLTYRNAPGRYAMSYPEGWTQLANGADVTIRDKNNLVRVALHSGPPPTLASVAAELARLRATTPGLVAGAPSAIQLKSGPAIKVTYQTLSAPNAVTNKRVALLVDRYEMAHNGKVATVDLGTPRGVDNVDAYKMMINSFRWQ